MIMCSFTSLAFFSLFDRAYLLDTDLFIVMENAKLPMFVSPVPHPQAWPWMLWSWIGTVGSGSICFLMFRSLPLVLQCLLGFDGQVTLIAPYWPTCPWFPCFQQWCPHSMQISGSYPGPSAKAAFPAFTYQEVFESTYLGFVCAIYTHFHGSLIAENIVEVHHPSIFIMRATVLPQSRNGCAVNIVVFIYIGQLLL